MAKADNQPEEQNEAPAVETVKMVRDVEVYPEGPHEADVHPDEIDNYAIGGWVRAE